MTLSATGSSEPPRGVDQSVFIDTTRSGELLVDAVGVTIQESLYLLRSDSLRDVMERTAEAGIVTAGRIYDADGRVLADADEDANRFSFEADEFGASFLASSEALFDRVYDRSAQFPWPSGS